MQDKGGNSQPMLTFFFFNKRIHIKGKGKDYFFTNSKGPLHETQGGFATYWLGDFGVTLKAFQIGLIFKIGAYSISHSHETGFQLLGTQ